MRVFKLQQKIYSDFPDTVNFMLICAETESQARDLATENEIENRGGQLWYEGNASFVDFDLSPNSAQVMLVS